MERTLLLWLLALTGIIAQAQAPFAKWMVQSGDSVNDQFLNHGDLIRLSNGDLLQCTSRDTMGQFNKTRFIRLSSEGDPLQQWEVSAPYTDFDKVIEQADGSFACFGRIGYSALYLHIASNGTPLVAKAYEVTGLGITAPWRWNDAVQDGPDRFTLAGEWPGSFDQGMIARIHLDGTLQAHDLVRVNGQNSQITSVIRLANGDHVFGGATNHGTYQARTFLFRTDSLLNLQWARSYPDSGYNYSFARVLEIPGGQFRILLRETDPAFVSSTLMVATASNGAPLWAVRRQPTAGYPSTLTWWRTAHIANGNIVVGGFGAPGFGRFVQIVDFNGIELDLGETDIPRPTYGVPGDAGTSYLAGIGPGPLGSGAYSICVARVDPTLDPCGTIHHNTTTEFWTPTSVTGWVSTPATVTVTDVLSQFTSYPTTAYMVPICITTMEAGIDAAVDEAALWPNPARERVTVRAAALEQVVIHDVTGRRVLVRSFGHTGEATFDIGHLPSGVYTAAIEHDGRWSHQVLIKE